MTIPYSTTRATSRKNPDRKMRYWELGTRRQKTTGLPLADLPAYEALGLDNLKSQRKALDYLDLYERAIAAKNQPRQEDDAFGGWPEGTLGATFHLYQQTEDWLVDKKPKTRAEWLYNWKRYIAPRFGDMQIDDITVSASEKFHRDVRKPKVDGKGRETDGLDLPDREAWSAVKVRRAILVMMQKKQIIERAPIGAVGNPYPEARAEFWLEEEIVQLVEAADELERTSKRPSDRARFRVAGLVIRLAWETALSAVDCRTFSLDMIKRDGKGVWRVERSRTKSGAKTRPSLSEALVADLKAYAGELGLATVGEAGMFRNTQGRAYTHTYMSHTFNAVRVQAFGKDEKRQLQDLRRSANLEADLGGATPEQRAALLANRLDKSKRLDGTYTPVTTLHAQKAQDARKVGRELLAQELGRKKVGKRPPNPIESV